MSSPHHNLCQTENQDVRRLHIGQGIEELRTVGMGGKIACVLSERQSLTYVCSLKARWKIKGQSDTATHAS